MRLSKEVVKQREERVLALFANGQNVEQANATLHQETNMKMAPGRLNELYAQHQKDHPSAVTPEPVQEEVKPSSFEKFTADRPAVELFSNNPNAKFKTVYKGKLLTIEEFEGLAEKEGTTL
jgi:hypothetical protein